ncbi:MAG: hypothetical protein Q9201_003908 [Fulgogasparrea decipioides]
MLSTRSSLVFVVAALSIFFFPLAKSQEIAPPVEIKGSKFFYIDNSSQFFLKGVVYQPIEARRNHGSVQANLASASNDTSFDDSLSQGPSCQRDIPFLQQLQTNVVRSYGINPSLDHDQCMHMFANAGIYAVVDLAAPGLAFSNANSVWDKRMYDRYTKVIDAMHKYTNLLGFIIGDSVIPRVRSNDSDVYLGYYVKAAVRDMKAYIRQRHYRSIPVGYVAPSFSGFKKLDGSKNVLDYLNCGGENDTIEFFGANVVYQCGTEVYEGLLGNENITQMLSNYSIPVFVAAYGCHEPTRRDFSEIPMLYSDKASSTWSGGLIYEYFQRGFASGYGLVVVAGDAVATLSNFADVSSQMATVSPPSVSAAWYTPSHTAAVTCPSGAPVGLPPNPVEALIAPSSTSTENLSAGTITSSMSAAASPSPHSSLSTGARAGLVVAAAVNVIAIAAAVLFLRQRRRQKKKGRAKNEHWTKAELIAEDINREARGYGPHMAGSLHEQKLRESVQFQKPPADRQVYEEPGKDDYIHEMPEALPMELPEALPQELPSEIGLAI